jgi:ATP-dependent DNA helicase RecG
MGSSVRNLYKFTKIYSGGEPELIEGGIFKTIIPIAAAPIAAASFDKKQPRR